MSSRNRSNYYLGKIGEQANQNQVKHEVRRYDADGNLIETIENPGDYWDKRKPKSKWKWSKR